MLQLRNSVIHIILVLGSFSFFVLLGEYARSGNLTSFDVLVFRSFNSISGQFYLDIAFIAVTQLGTTIAWLIFTVLASIFFKGKRVKVALMLGLALIGSELLEAGLKPVYQRERPFVSLQGVILPAGISTGFSFPSGHALRSFAGSLVLLRFRKSIGYTLLGVSVLVAFSRVYLGLHYPSDVVASFLLAYLLTEFIILVERRITSRVGQMKPSIDSSVTKVLLSTPAGRK